jgi:hypothetical protein
MVKRSRLSKGTGKPKGRLWVVEWTELKKAVVTASNEEEAEQKAYDLPDIEVHQESNIRRIERARKGV